MILNGFLTIMIIYWFMQKIRIIGFQIFCQEQINKMTGTKIQIMIQEVHGHLQISRNMDQHQIVFMKL